MKVFLYLIATSILILNLSGFLYLLIESKQLIVSPEDNFILMKDTYNNFCQELENKKLNPEN